jgi:hypothetical protein
MCFQLLHACNRRHLCGSSWFQSSHIELCSYNLLTPTNLVAPAQARVAPVRSFDTLLQRDLPSGQFICLQRQLTVVLGKSIGASPLPLLNS